MKNYFENYMDAVEEAERMDKKEPTHVFRIKAIESGKGSGYLWEVYPTPKLGIVA